MKVYVTLQPNEVATVLTIQECTLFIVIHPIDFNWLGLVTQLNPGFVTNKYAVLILNSVEIHRLLICLCSKVMMQIMN